MDRGDLARQLVGYNGWANDRIVRAARDMTDVRGRSPGASFGSVLATLGHIYDAETSWYERWQGRLDPPDAEFDSLGAAIAALKESQARLGSYVAAWTDGAWDEMLTFGNEPPQTLSRGAMLTHVVIHSTFHRGEAALLLTAGGCSPGDLDLLDYLDAGLE